MSMLLHTFLEIGTGSSYEFIGSGEPGANIEIIIQGETMRTTVDGNGKYWVGKATI